MIDFGFQLGSQEGAPELNFRGLGASWDHLGAILGPSWGHLGAKMASRPPQTPPKGLLKAILEDLGLHFDGFLNGFGAQLGRFLDSLAIDQKEAIRATRIGSIDR